MKIISQILLLSTAGFIWGIWCGEDLTKLFGISFLGIAVVIVLMFLAIYFIQGVKMRILGCTTTIASLVAGVILGIGAASSAFNECVADGELVRNHIQKFYITNGRYPEKLSELNTQLPGKLIIRGNIMDYKKTNEGYSLLFEDWLITHTASESLAFTASK
ncbi:type II secretion system protein [Persicirhabdus sediminis]|uniref:Uncharacterized protein n=1 Tax=Persicirhabdus sediminis TaxID=454144 RepID=A0A8J7SGD5_9BACT|nr:hypothetical protein [Persicirhabdus sediminis]MBK1790050.1 hypothetical protein [Persicirhabdus sediminis]